MIHVVYSHYCVYLHWNLRIGTCESEPADRNLRTGQCRGLTSYQGRPSTTNQNTNILTIPICANIFHINTTWLWWIEIKLISIYLAYAASNNKAQNSDGEIICDLANEKGPQGGKELLVVQYCQEDADFNTKKSSSRSDKNAKVIRFQHFQHFSKNFTQFLGYAVCWGEKYGGEKSLQKKFRQFFFWRNLFYFSKIYLVIIFIFHSLCQYKFHLH